jgi:hypothetical protein
MDSRRRIFDPCPILSEPIAVQVALEPVCGNGRCLHLANAVEKGRFSLGVSSLALVGAN